jgi:hypothetical protein
VGDLDDSYNEFVSSDKRVIDYQVPSYWQLMLGQNDPNWGAFPYFLYTWDDNDVHPQEIRINFGYLEDYYNPTLIIRVTVDPNHPFDPNNPHYLELFKGEREVFIGNRVIENRPFYPYIFSLGYIKKGINKKNMFVIRSNGPSGIPVVFDTVYLFLDDDSDGDGVSDADEGDFYKDSNSVVCIPIKSYHPDPLFKKKIILNINELEDASPFFREVKFLDPNVLNLSEWLGTDRFLPYGYLSFKLEDIGTQEKIALQVSFIDQPSPSFYPSVRFHTCQDPNACQDSNAYQDTNNWQETDFELLDGNTAVIPLSDGGIGDYDGEKSGTIHTILTLSYPKSLDAQIERGACFIKAVQWRRDYGTDF